jgi:tetratricopeptide (TPR) repeat protein
VLAVLVAGGPRSYSVGFGFAEWPWWRYLLTQAGVVAHYVSLSVVPWPLVLDYEWPPSDLAHAAAPGLFVLALVAASGWALARRRPLGFIGAWFFVILAPTSTVIPIVTEVAAEHRLYLPLAAPIALVVLGAYWLAARRVPTPATSLRLSAGAAVVAVAGGLGALTYARNADYADYDRIWSRTIAARPQNTRALNNYATSLMTQRRFDQAEHHLRAAIAVNPAFADGHANLGVALCSQGKYAEGIDHLRRSAALDPERPATFRNLAEAHGAQGQMRDALENYARALALLPDDVGLLNRAAWILATSRDGALRDGARARAYAERAVRLTARRDTESLDSLAAALAEIGDFAAAVAAETEAIAAARGAGAAALVPELQSRLEMYRRGQKFRDAA